MVKHKWVVIALVFWINLLVFCLLLLSILFLDVVMVMVLVVFLVVNSLAMVVVLAADLCNRI